MKEGYLQREKHHHHSRGKGGGGGDLYNTHTRLSVPNSQIIAPPPLSHILSMDDDGRCVLVSV